MKRSRYIAAEAGSALVHQGELKIIFRFYRSSLCSDGSRYRQVRWRRRDADDDENLISRVISRRPP